jgi:hypothetical protein
VSGARTGLYAEFRTADELLEAVSALRAAGLRRLDAFTPFDVPGLAERMELPRSRIPRFVFAGGALGAAAGFLIQVYANVWHYPLNAGGRPTFALPSFVFSTFEAMVLGASFAALLAFLFPLRLPQLWHPAFEVVGFESAMDDRFWVAVDDRDPAFNSLSQTRLLKERGAAHVYVVERS